jgi:hypothetical protein
MQRKSPGSDAASWPEFLLGAAWLHIRQSPLPSRPARGAARDGSGKNRLGIFNRSPKLVIGHTPSPGGASESMGFPESLRASVGAEPLEDFLGEGERPCPLLGPFSDIKAPSLMGPLNSEETGW